MEKYFLLSLIVLGILLIVCFIVIFKMYKKVSDLQKKQHLFDKKLEGQSVEDLLYDVLREEIEIIKPKIIMCCGTWYVVNYHLNCEELEKNGCKVLCMPHPAARKSSLKMLEDLRKQ